ncbi:hypothetical protein ABH926_006743 [Catenulispora sp. GP43]|uniref:hypothetical protein n=1 Tax=Catenulispora sp. GP43 TaxID=3156263 RepID=UPI003517A248
MTPVRPAQPPRIRVTREARRLQLEVDLEIYGPTATGSLAIAAVIEDSDGDLDYWALNHVSPGPDFHHPDSFIISA